MLTMKERLLAISDKQPSIPCRLRKTDTWHCTRLILRPGLQLGHLACTMYHQPCIDCHRHISQPLPGVLCDRNDR